TNFDCDFLRQIALRHGGGDQSDVSHLTSEVRRHRIHVVGEILPRTGDAGNVGLTTEAAFGSHFARHARYFSREHAQAVHHRVDVVRKVLPRSRYARHICLSAEPTFGSHFLGNASYFGGKGAQLIDHGVDRLLELENLALDVDGDLAREIALGDGRRDVSDIA